jgi:uncharacterized protein YndB with AHSA1/START domain
MTDRRSTPDGSGDDVGSVARRRSWTGATRSVLVSRRYPATIEQLWDTCTQPDLLARWYGSVTGDTSVGGSVRLGDDATCEILRCERPERLDVSWQAFGETNIVSLTLVAEPDGTALTLEHLGLIDERLLDYGPGWERQLSRLATFLSPGSNPADNHEVQAQLERDRGDAWARLSDEPDVRFGRADGVDSMTFFRVLDAPRDHVWTAVTTAGGLSAWFGAATGDLDRGGDWTVDFGGGTASGTVQDCQPGLGFTTTYRQGIDGPDQVHRVRLELAEEDGLTRLTLRHTFPPGSTPHLRRGMSAGWSAFLASLHATLAGRTPEAVEATWMVEFRVAAIALGSGAEA